MNKKILVVGIILLLIAVGFSGCTEEKGISSDNENTEEYLDTEENDTEQDLPDEEDDEPEEEESEPDADENHAPNTPNKPYGPTIGNVDVEYTYSQSTTDPDGDLVKYRFDWGDGTYSDWSDLREHEISYSLSHSWSSSGTYELRIQAKDENGDTSDWSNPLTVEIEEGTEEILYPSFVDWMCRPPSGNYNVELKPTLMAMVSGRFFPSGFKIPNFYITWYTKHNGVWVDEKKTELLSDDEFYYYFKDADEYSTIYYWKIVLSDEDGTIYDEAEFSFTTIRNAPAVIIDYENPNWPAELQPTINVTIEDKNGDLIDLTFYEKINNVWVVTQFDQNLEDGTYSYVYQSATEYNTLYYWKVVVTDEYGPSSELMRWFRTKTDWD